MKKKFKQIAIYVLVALIVSSSVSFCYQRVRSVEAAVVVDDVLIITTLLGAMGLVYIGNQWLTGYAPGDRSLYDNEVLQLEDTLKKLYDNATENYYMNNMPDLNPDDFDPENDNPEDKPPTWEKLKAWMKAHPMQSLVIGTTALGGVFASVASKLDKQIESPQYSIGDVSLSEQVQSELSYCLENNLYYVAFMESADLSSIYYGSSCPTLYYDSSSGSYYFSKWECQGYRDYNGSAFSKIKRSIDIGTSFVTNIPFEGSLSILDNSNILYSSNPRCDEYGNIILPIQEIAPVGQVQLAPLLDALYNANQVTDAEQAEQLKQQAVDDYISSLENPKVNPDPGTDPDPDIDNGSFLADLKLLFPFCVPFDLVDCFRLFNSEPVTPRVEIPIHFGIVEKDYTFVIDLSDFDGVAMVCRSMFLVLFMTGLIMSTRNLIRG